jgi:hypothetical protein
MSDKVVVYLDTKSSSDTFLRTIFKDSHGNVALQASHIACANGEVVSLDVKGTDMPYLTPKENLQLKLDDTKHNSFMEFLELIWNGKITQEFTESPFELSCRNAAAQRSRSQPR